MSFVVKGSVVVVTGGANGIGKAVCEHLANGGASKVIVVDMNFEAARQVAESLPDKVGVAMRANCGVEMDLRRVIVTAEFQFGGIDAVVANAGIPSNGGVEVPNDEWSRIWQVNVMQHVYIVRHWLPYLQARAREEPGRKGALLVTASAAGLLTQVGSLPYSVTKHAAVSAAEWLAISYSNWLSVSCLCPQAVQTGMIPKGTGGGVAGGDGVLTAAAVAAESIAALQTGQFLVLPHKNVKKYFQNKANDYDRWLKGMGKLHKGFGEMMLRAPNTSAAKL